MSLNVETMKPKLSRQLATVMFSDMVGYSQLMDQDEEIAISFRNRMESVLQDLIPKYDGKILQFYGDGALSIFDSTVEAIQCAGLIQEAMHLEPVIPLRIGIHVGDIARGHRKPERKRSSKCEYGFPF